MRAPIAGSAIAQLWAVSVFGVSTTVVGSLRTATALDSQSLSAFCTTLMTAAGCRWRGHSVCPIRAGWGMKRSLTFLSASAVTTLANLYSRGGGLWYLLLICYQLHLFHHPLPALMSDVDQVCEFEYVTCCKPCRYTNNTSSFHGRKATCKRPCVCKDLEIRPSPDRSPKR
ncbi:hypothetical protein T492DRAFT_216924 [Pavlovales sp. CCMP2436]|nr:hypothetical protein T492DRAFT_216924 [Pavlovales sp. CCMP2436]